MEIEDFCFVKPKTKLDGDGIGSFTDKTGNGTGFGYGDVKGNVSISGGYLISSSKNNIYRSTGSGCPSGKMFNLFPDGDGECHGYWKLHFYTTKQW